MPLFMRDNRNQTWRYLQAPEHDGQSAAWQNMKGEFKEASKATYQTKIELFHADDFEQIHADIAARSMIFGTLANWMDHGVITPNGDFYGVHNGKHDQFVENLELMAEHLPDRLAKQLASKDVSGTWLYVSHNEEPKDIPSDVTFAQLMTLRKTGYLKDSQIVFSEKLHSATFPKGNPAFAALSDACFDALDAGDRFRREHRAGASAHAAIGIENGFTAPC